MAMRWSTSACLRLRPAAAMDRGNLEGVHEGKKAMIHGTTVRVGTLRRVLLCLLLLGLLWPRPAGAEEGEKPESPLRLEYTVSIRPEDRRLGVTGTLRGYRGEPIRQFQSRGLREKINIGLSKARDGSMVFRYDLPIRQSTFRDTFKPVLNEDFFTGFCNHLFVLPRIEGRGFDRLALSVAAPKGWKVATSRGIGAAWELAGIPDLMGTLICAGDYFTDSFELAHAGGDATTKVHVAIRGDRDWDDGVFVEQFRRLVRGQMEFFGGTHPAPFQFLALHILSVGAPG